MLKNVVIVSDFAYINGGNSKVAIDNAIKCSERFNVYFFTGEEKIDERLNRDNIEVIFTGGEEFLKSKNKAAAFLSYVYDKDVYIKFDNLLSKLDKNETVVHVHSWAKVLSPSVLKVLSKRHFRTLITCHDYFSVCPNGGLFNYKKNQICQCKNRFSCFFSNCDSRSYLYKMVRNVRFGKQKRFLKKIEKDGNLNFAYISKSQKSLFDSFFKKAHYYYLPNNIDLYPDKKIDANNNNIYLYIGRVSSEKGINNLVDAFNNLPESTLYVIGEGPILEEEKKRSNSNIHYLGWKNKNKINDLLKQARCLVFPSVWYEGSPLTIPEVMSAGIPCIVSNLCNGKDFIEDGKNGWLFDCNSKEKLIQLISTVSKTDVSNISDNAYSIRAKYDKSIDNLFFETLSLVSEEEQ